VTSTDPEALVRRALIVIITCLALPAASLAGEGRVVIRSNNDLLTVSSRLESQECMLVDSKHPFVLELEGPGHLVIWSRINLPRKRARKARAIKLLVLKNGQKFKSFFQKAAKPRGKYDEVTALRPGPLKELGFGVPEGRHVYRFKVAGKRNLGACLGFAFRLPSVAAALPTAPMSEDGELGVMPLVPLAPVAPVTRDEPAAPALVSPHEDERDVLADLRRPEDRPAASELARKRRSGMPDLPDEDEVEERRRHRRTRSAFTVTETDEERQRRREAALRAKEERERRRDDGERSAALQAKEERERRLAERERRREETERRRKGEERQRLALDDEEDGLELGQEPDEMPDLSDEEEWEGKRSEDMPEFPDEEGYVERREPDEPPEPPQPPVIDAHVGLTPRAGFFVPLGPGNPTGVVGVEARWHLPMLRRMVSLGASVSYYLTNRKGVVTGRVPAEYELEMHVLPVCADLALRVPTGSSFTPIIGGGGGYYHAWAENRVHGASRSGSGGSFGYHGFAGLALDLPLGEAGLTVLYSSARLDAGTVCENCEVGGIKVDLSYQFLF